MASPLSITLITLLRNEFSILQYAHKTYEILLYIIFLKRKSQSRTHLEDTILFQDKMYNINAVGTPNLEII